MQGLGKFIPTQKKIEYLNQLLLVGFDTLDFGSFVSPKAVPQMKDTRAVLGGLDLKNTTTKLLAIVANLRGAQEACAFPEIQYLGFPLSISETFQQRNAHQTISQGLELVKNLLDLCGVHHKKLVLYLSMAFGNPYGDVFHLEEVAGFVDRVKNIGVEIVSLSDTIGAGGPDEVYFLVDDIKAHFPDLEMGVHLHSTPVLAREKINAAFMAGCRRFDGALKGYGGCPMASDSLVGNIPTELILSCLKDLGIGELIIPRAFQEAFVLADEIFKEV